MSAEAQLTFLFSVLVLVGIGLVVLLRSDRRPGTGVLMATWLVLTALLLWAVALVSFVGVYILFFAMGKGAAAAGFIVAALALVAAPFVAALLVRHIGHGLTPHP